MTVLIIASNKVESDIVDILFDSLRVKTLIANNIDEAMRATKDVDIDMILVHLELEHVEFFWPDERFIDVFHLIRELKKGMHKVPLVAYSTFDGAQMGGEAYLNGANLYLTSPLSPHTLIDVLDRFDIQHGKARRLSI